MSYKLTQNPSIVMDTETGVFIPEDSDNPLWNRYQLFLVAGGTPDPADKEPEPVVTQAPIPDYVIKLTDRISALETNVAQVTNELATAAPIVPEPPITQPAS